MKLQTCFSLQCIIISSESVSEENLYALVNNLVLKLLQKPWGPFTVGGGTYREKTDLIKIKATGGLLQFFLTKGDTYFACLSFWSIMMDENKNFIDLL